MARFQRNKKMRTSIEHGEARYAICPNGWRNSLIIQWKKKLLPQVKHLSREPLHQEPPIKVVSGKRKTEIAKYARGPRSQGLLAESAQVIKYFEQKKFGDLITAITKF